MARIVASTVLAVKVSAISSANTVLEFQSLGVDMRAYLWMPTFRANLIPALEVNHLSSAVAPAERIPIGTPTSDSI